MPKARGKTRSESEACEVLLETYAANDAMNQLLIARLDPRAWRAHRATEKSGEGGALAEISSHLHNNRLVWLEFAVGPSTLHDKAGPRGASQKRGSMPGNAEGNAVRVHFQAR